MSRSISVWYNHNEKDIDVEVGNQDLLGTQGISYAFWSLKKLREIGLKELNLLGRKDPVGFSGWDGMEFLENEIEILERHREEINFNHVARDRWIENLRYCFNKLVTTAPNDSTPHFMIG